MQIGRLWILKKIVIYLELAITIYGQMSQDEHTQVQVTSV